MSVRRAAVAGTWYPGTASRLTAEVESHLSQAALSRAAVLPSGAELVALIAPHAGLVYSGPVAAYAYHLIKGRRFDAVILVGPSHYVAFDGASIWPDGAFETPLGELRVDRDLAQALIAASPLIHDRPAAHAREHSLEMQTPFLAALARDLPIVPIVMGQQTRETACDLADAIVHAAAGRRVLLVASSDLSHFYDAPTAARLDAQVIEAVEMGDPDMLMARIEARPDHACGGGPMVTVLRAARALGATSSRVLKYADSGDISGDKSSVVGYLAAALWR
jgi:AmmeMemoRadiSam system protein B